MCAYMCTQTHDMCVCSCSIADTMNHTNKEKPLSGDWQFQNLSPLSSWQGAWWHAERIWSWELYTLICRQRVKERVRHELRILNCPPQPWHTFFNKVTRILRLSNPSNLFEQFHTLVTKHLKMWAYGRHSCSSHHCTQHTILLFL